eukprot:1108056-Amphidinium_carterae.1
MKEICFQYYNGLEKARDHWREPQTRIDEEKLKVRQKQEEELQRQQAEKRKSEEELRDPAIITDNLVAEHQEAHDQIKAKAKPSTAPSSTASSIEPPRPTRA